MGSIPIIRSMGKPLEMLKKTSNFKGFSAFWRAVILRWMVWQMYVLERFLTLFY